MGRYVPRAEGGSAVLALGTGAADILKGRVVDLDVERRGSAILSRPLVLSSLAHLSSQYLCEPSPPLRLLLSCAGFVMRLGTERQCVSKRMLSGCAYCGSKAHELLVCPQRPDPRKSAATRSEEGSGCVGRKEDPVAE